MTSATVGKNAPLGRRLKGRALVALVVTLTGLGACMTDAPTGRGPSSHLRFVQAVPNAPAVDLVVDDTPLMTVLGFRTVTLFTEVEAGPRRVRMRTSGPSPITLFDTTLAIEFPRAYTLLATGMANDIEPIVAPDTEAIPAPSTFKVRVIQAAPAAGTVDVYVTDANALLSASTPVLEDLPFRGNSEYLTFPVGRLRVRLTTAGTTNVLLDMTQLFGERAMRTIVATDAAGGGTPLTGLYLVDY